jgi:hypothetical protein
MTGFATARPRAPLILHGRAVCSARRPACTITTLGPSRAAISLPGDKLS